MENMGIKIAEIDQRCKSNTHRIDRLEERQDNLDKLVTSVTALATEQEHIKEDVTEIKVDVKTLAEKPGKRWDGLVEKVIWAVAGAMIVYLLGQLGL